LLQERFSALLCPKCSGPLLEGSESSRHMTCSDCGHSASISGLIENAFQAHALFNEGLY
jgi:hypothetical protein